MPVSPVEAGCRIEFGVAFGGGVVTQAPDALTPGAGLGQRWGDVGGVGAVDHEVVRAGVAVDFADRLGQGEAASQSAVGLDSEGDRHRQAGGAGGLHDADRLTGAGGGERADHVGARGCEGLDLRPMVSRRLTRAGADAHPRRSARMPMVRAFACRAAHIRLFWFR
jgi:hypothetical protein